MVVACQAVCTSEFGVSTYRPGMMDLFPGCLPPPGATMLKSYFLYQDDNGVADNRELRMQAHTVSGTRAFFAGHVTDVRVLGSNWAFAATGQVRLSQQSMVLKPAGFPLVSKNSTVGGLGDLILIPGMFSWKVGPLHLLAALSGYVPTGSYHQKRIINIGTNRWAVEPDAGLTWIGSETGREVSLFAGYTINLRNSATDYRSGDEFHADFALAQHFPRGLVIGATGYTLQQTTKDSGSGAIFDAYRGRVIALGPLVSKTVEIAELPISFTLKYDFEFAARNRSTAMRYG